MKHRRGAFPTILLSTALQAFLKYYFTYFQKTREGKLDDSTRIKIQ